MASSESCWSNYTPTCGYTTPSYCSSQLELPPPPESIPYQPPVMDTGDYGGYKVENSEEYYDSGYWGGNYGGYMGASQGYPATSPMVLYPSLYSTVNQNQIHLHVHNVTEYRLPEATNQEGDITATIGPNNVTINAPSRNIEIDIVQEEEGMHRYDRQQDPSVWRPY